MRSARLCKATAPKWRFGLHFSDGGLRIIPCRTGEAMSTSGNSGLHRLLAGTVGAGRLFSTCLCAPPELMNVVTEDTMTDYPDVLFNKSPEQLRRLGARGGRAHARNQRARWALMTTR